MKPQGLLLVLSGPSGAGKGTICQMLREKLPDLAYSVSVTTRQARNGEVDGVNYFFKSVEEVKQMISEGELLEYAEVYGNYYGTPRSYVMELLNQGKDVILEIDIQGAMQIKKRFPDGVFVFIVPPSLDELCSRIYKRGTLPAQSSALNWSSMDLRRPSACWPPQPSDVPIWAAR